MGKSKKRIFNKNKNQNGTSIKREDAVSLIVKNIKQNTLDKEINNLITLFGITAEELAEAGACYEEIRAIKSLL